MIEENVTFLVFAPDYQQYVSWLVGEGYDSHRCIYIAKLEDAYGRDYAHCRVMKVGKWWDTPWIAQAADDIEERIRVATAQQRREL